MAPPDSGGANAPFHGSSDSGGANASFHGSTVPQRSPIHSWGLLFRLRSAVYELPIVFTSSLYSHPSKEHRLPAVMDGFPQETRDIIAAQFVVRRHVLDQLPEWGANMGQSGNLPGPGCLSLFVHHFDCLKIQPCRGEDETQYGTSDLLTFPDVPDIDWMICSLARVSPNWRAAVFRTIRSVASQCTRGAELPRLHLPSAMESATPTLLDSVTASGQYNGEYVRHKARDSHFDHCLTIVTRNCEREERASGPCRVRNARAELTLRSDVGVTPLRRLRVLDEQDIFRRANCAVYGISGLHFAADATRAAIVASTRSGVCGVADLRFQVFDLERLKLLLGAVSHNARAGIRHLLIDVEELHEENMAGMTAAIWSFVSDCTSLESFALTSSGGCCDFLPPTPQMGPSIREAFHGLRLLVLSELRTNTQALIGMLVPSIRRLLLQRIDLEPSSVDDPDAGHSWGSVFTYIEMSLPLLRFLGCERLAYHPHHPRHFHRYNTGAGMQPLQFKYFYYVIATDTSVSGNDDLPRLVSLVESVCSRVQADDDREFLKAIFFGLDTQDMLGLSVEDSVQQEGERLTPAEFLHDATL